MRLLDTTTLKLHEFIDAANTPQYAIHVPQMGRAGGLLRGLSYWDESVMALAIARSEGAAHNTPMQPSLDLD